ncbi:M43 family zinc metalloprotease [Cryomorphaceae bacterium 1068]|nr:M43 family zinc metalloprotease [Cryomorphaceae bacterium 1068]
MRRFQSLLLVVATMLISTTILAQEQDFVDPGHLTCAKNDATEALFQKYPEQRAIAEQARKKLQAETEAFSNSKGNEDDVIIIPVVFHVVHAGGDENISDEQIQSAIDVLNEDFNAANSDIDQVVDEFADIVGDVGFEFRLAKIDPDGNCTNGITRHLTELTDEGFFDMKDETGIWDRSSYLNIWTCRQIGEGTAGYTFIPSTVSGGFGQLYDGIVLLHDYVGRIGTSNSTRSHALSHEVGHWANLEHTWGTDNNPADPSSCSGSGSSDFVSDTPNTIGWTSCDLDGATCGSLDNVENFMDYSYCYKMFTEGQGNRMTAAMNSSTAQRNQLWTDLNLAETGVLDPAEICFAEFVTDRDPNICAGQEIGFDDISYNGVENRTWTFEGGTPSTSSENNPVVVYDTPGTYSVTLSVSNAQGEETVVKEDLINVLGEAQYALPFQEGFEDMSDIEENNEWVVVNPDESGIRWTLTDQASLTGDQSVYVRGRTNDDFQTETLESPTFDLSGLEDNAVLSFKYAHARRNSNSDDFFQVRISRNCGENWNLRETRDIDELPTVSGNVSGQFFPDSDGDWEEVIIDNISSIFLTDEFRIRFEFTSVGGNNIFIDDINIYDPNTLSVDNNEVVKEITLFPNPATDNVRLRLDLSENQNIRIDVVDASGRVVQSPYTGTMTSGTQSIQIQLDSSLTPGMYFVRLTGEEGIAVRKLIVK